MGYPSVAVLKENGLSVFFISTRESNCRQTGAGYFLFTPAINILTLIQKLCRNKDTEIVAVILNFKIQAPNSKNINQMIASQNLKNQ